MKKRAAGRGQQAAKKTPSPKKAMPKPIAVGYIRVSTDDQVEGVSLDANVVGWAPPTNFHALLILVGIAHPTTTTTTTRAACLAAITDGAEIYCTVFRHDRVRQDTGPRVGLLVETPGGRIPAGGLRRPARGPREGELWDLAALHAAALAAAVELAVVSSGNHRLQAARLRRLDDLLAAILASQKRERLELLRIDIG